MKQQSLRRGKQFVLILLLVLYCTFSLRGQRSYTAPSPTAAGLGLYGQVPVSEYSGIPDITIPITTIQVQQFQLPINLSYHGGGIKAKDKASWVGMNWSLNAGGVITRSKRHLDDLGTFGYYNKTDNWPCDDTHDQEPDVFYFKFGGYSGKFVIDRPSGNGPYTIRQFSKSNIKIELITSNNTWLVTDPNGTRYYFEKKENTDESSTSSGTTTYYGYHISAWYLTSIKLLNDESITLEYETSANKVTQTSSVVTTNELTSYTPIYITCCMPSSSFPPRQVNYVSSNTINNEEVVLKKITYNEGFLEFVNGARTDLTFTPTNVSGKKLEKVNIYSGTSVSNQLLKSFDLAYDYYQNSTPSTEQRLRLISIQEKGLVSSKPPYEFYYNSDVLSTTSALGGFQLFGSQGLLSKIIYPTGGRTEFEFERNMYYNQALSSNMFEGGARIKRISSTSNEGKTIISRYEYEGGKLMGEGRPLTQVNYSTSSLRTTDCCDIQASVSNPIVVVFYFAFKTLNDFNSLGETLNGGIIGYDKVTRYAGNNGEGGKVITYFQNQAPVLPNYFNGSVPVQVPVDVSNMNGAIAEIQEYSNVGGSFQLARRTENVYTSSEAVTINASRRADNNCNFPYSFKTEWIKLTSQKVSTFDENGLNPIVKETIYSYGNTNANPISSQTFDSEGNVLVVESKYSTEKAAEAGGVYSLMAERNMVNQQVEIVKKTNGIQNEKLTTLFRDWYGDGKVIMPEFEEYQGKVSDPVLRKTSYNSYDTKSNLLQVKQKDGIIQSFQWGVESKFPIVKAENCKNELTYTEGFTTQGNSFYIGGSSGSSYGGQSTFFHAALGDITLFVPWTPPPTASVTIYYTLSGPAYRQGTLCTGGSGTTSCTGLSNSVILAGMPKGNYTLSYLVSCNFTSYPLICTFSYNFKNIQTSPFREFLYEGFETNLSTSTDNPFAGKRYFSGDYTVSFVKPNSKAYKINYHYRQGGAWKNITKDFTGPTMLLTEGDGIDEIRIYPNDAAITTYTFDPLIGVTSETDPNGSTILYEYDDLLQLKTVRDNNRQVIKHFDYQYRYLPCAANWQNTATPVRCKQTGGINTGEVEQEQQDVNPCSATAGNIRWVIVGMNTSMCPLPGCSISMFSGYSSISNSISSSGGTVSFSLNFYPVGSSMTTGNEYVIAIIDGSCRPSGTRTININASGRSWLLTIFASGHIRARLNGGSPVSPGSPVSFSGTFSN